MEKKKAKIEQEIINELNGKYINIKNERYGETILKITDKIISVEIARDDMGALFYLYGNSNIDTLVLTDGEVEILTKMGLVYIGNRDPEILTTVEFADL